MGAVKRGMIAHGSMLSTVLSIGLIAICPMLTGTAAFPASREQSDTTILVQLDAPETDVLKAVQEVTEDQIIHGTYSYEKEKTLYGAHAADSSPVFGLWQEGGKAFYKVAENVLSPRFFKESGDTGTVAVRYVVQGINPSSTSLRIDATYVDARHTRHKSQGNVESHEYEAVQEHLRNLQAKRKEDQNEEQNLAKQREDARARAKRLSDSTGFTARLPVNDSTSTAQLLEQKVDGLRRQVELRVKSSGASLRSAPYRSASTIQPLGAATEVVIVVLTPYWYGVETEDGHKGWIRRSELEPLP